MIPLVIFGTSLGVGLSGALVPGPLFVVNVSETVKRGFIAAPLVILGHSVAELLVVIGLSLGLSRFVENVAVMGVIGVAGGGILVWMGYRMFGQTRAGKIRLDLQSDSGSGGLNPVAGGVLASVANPYWILWWGTIGLAYVSWSLEYHIIGLASFYFGHIMADFSWYCLVSLMLVSSKTLLSDRIFRGMLYVCAVFLIALGLYFVGSGVGPLGRQYM